MGARIKYTEGVIADETSVPAVIAKLMALHTENQEIGRLINLLRRSTYSTIAFLLCAVGALALFHHFSAATFGWLVLIAVAIGAQARAHFLAYHGPMQRQALQFFEADFEKVLLMSGFSWSAGAFLATTSLTPIAAIDLFAILPCVFMAVLLRTRGCVLWFIAPVAVLSALACIVRLESYIGALIIVLGCAAAAALAGISDRSPAIKFPLVSLSPTSRVFSAVTQR